MLAVDSYPKYAALLMPKLEGVDQNLTIEKIVKNRKMWFCDEGSFTVCPALKNIAKQYNAECEIGIKVNAYSVPEKQPLAGQPIYKQFELDIFNFAELNNYWLRYNDNKIVYGWPGNRIFDLTNPEMLKFFKLKLKELLVRVNVNKIFLDELQFGLGYLPNAINIKTYAQEITSDLSPEARDIYWEQSSHNILRSLPPNSVVANGATFQPENMHNFIFIQNASSMNSLALKDRIMMFLENGSDVIRSRNIILENQANNPNYNFIIGIASLYDCALQFSDGIFKNDPIGYMPIASGEFGKPIEYLNYVINATSQQLIPFVVYNTDFSGHLIAKRFFTHGILRVDFGLKTYVFIKSNKL